MVLEYEVLEILNTCLPFPLSALLIFLLEPPILKTSLSPPAVKLLIFINRPIIEIPILAGHESLLQSLSPFP